MHTHSDPVADAFSALAKALGNAAVADGGDFERCGAFRASVLAQAERWANGGHPNRARKAAAAEGAA